MFKREPVTKTAVARDRANPIFPIKPFRLKMRRKESIIDVENQIKLPVFH
jgi:hypothetical protein